MATSGTYSFSVTRDDIIRQALLNIKRLDPDESPTPAETNDCARMLNMMVKQWMGKTDFAPGLKVWTRRRGHRLLSVSTGAYAVGPGVQGWANDMQATSTALSAVAAATALTLESTTGISSGYTLAVQLTTNVIQYLTASSVVGSVVNFTSTPLAANVDSGAAVFFYATTAQNPRAIETAVLRDFDNQDTVLNVMTVQSYDALPNKADALNAGDPNSIYFEEGLSTSTVYTDVGAAIDITKRIIIPYQEPVQDFNNPLDEPYYPQEWYLALCWGLTEQISPMFSAVWNEKMEQLKNTSLAIARNHSAEVSEAYFEPGD
jgi:hypothetical protein